MGEAFLYGSGGGAVGLNFEIKAYSSEDSFPETAKENTIAVITDTPITSYAFSVEEPSEPVEGLLWIKTGTASRVEFNLLKKNTVMTYPVSAYQYEGGAWVMKTAKTYQNGAWQDWITYAFYQGDTCDGLTGGWVAKARNTNINPVTPTLTISGGVMTVSAYRETARNYFGGTGQTANAIDMSDFATVTFVVTEVVDTSGGGVLRIGVTDDADSEQYTMNAYVEITAAGTHVVDVSEVNTACVIAINPRSAGTAGSTAAITVSEIILE